jgi:hypothetical protein
MAMTRGPEGLLVSSHTLTVYVFVRHQPRGEGVQNDLNPFALISDASAQSRVQGLDQISSSVWTSPCTDKFFIDVVEKYYDKSGLWRRRVRFNSRFSLTWLRRKRQFSSPRGRRARIKCCEDGIIILYLILTALEAILIFNTNE